MLELARAGIEGVDLDELAAAIDHCLGAAQTCSACADMSLAERDATMLSDCIAFNQDCADLCIASARILSRAAHADHVLVHRVLRACVRACERCAAECERH